MWRLMVLALAVTISGGVKPASVKSGLTFLTRNGCINTPRMAKNLDGALAAIGWPKDYQRIDIGALSSTDARTGYPTPTILWKGRDIFGLSVPQPPFSSPM